jgi:hypothetical protein
MDLPAYAARSFRVPGIYSEALRRQGRLESLTTLFERFARNEGERPPGTRAPKSRP